ncbi:glycerol-3-phosphate dehydrogenase subunit B [Desulfobaculum xiamenense]|uniref:Glycerol-3-phosphate dehydrogenase subunit B n=1 Tax=Desulfobaculum xiamenense TaxID=995050 RepID=A0A846QTQ6_9BACT|nr:glycerol-3-phosphate dehydrogenase subunit GlpB [Desulfobaculum xiamenense]NJB68554.1 glycerol-3-phosphate dehydrogenase subunit B [Desulfobaculum xiamenense]
MTPPIVDADLAVVGCGLAGCAAAARAAERGQRVALIGSVGAMVFTSGYLDALGIAPGPQRRPLDDPWAGIAALSDAEPMHPLARLGAGEVRAALEWFLNVLAQAGVPYVAAGDANFVAMTPAGTVKRTWAVPATMRPGVEALSDGGVCMIVGVEGLRGFSARQVAANLAAARPGVLVERVAFPGMAGREDVYAEHMARALEVPDILDGFAEVLRPRVGGVRYVGLPAILGVHAPERVRARLEERLGVTVFEIPCMPPSVPGIRLREALEEALPKMGVTLVPSRRVLAVRQSGEGFELEAGVRATDTIVRARGVVLATGRFLGGGLRATRAGVEETVFGLPVSQPESRSGWHARECFDPRGHGINRAGLEVDDAMRPLGRDGAPVSGTLFAAGSVLAHQDWIRSRCGAGLAVSTACRAVDAFVEPES